MTKKFSDIILVDTYQEISKGRVFEVPGKPHSKLYKILGFEIEADKVNVYAQRVIRPYLKVSPKQPIFEVFNFEDTLKQKIDIRFMQKSHKWKKFIR